MVAIAVFILILRATSIQRTLPELSQVGVNEAVGIPGTAQTIVWRLIPTGSVANGRRRVGIARPYKPILLVIAEILCLAVS